MLGYVRGECRRQGGRDYEGEKERERKGCIDVLAAKQRGPIGITPEQWTGGGFCGIAMCFQCLRTQVGESAIITACSF